MPDSGEFVRRDSLFRQQLSSAPGAPFRAEPGRYHLYVSYACPWAHRTLIVRELKGLTHTVSVSVVDPVMGREGWTLNGDEPGTTGDPVNGFRVLSEAYQRTEPGYHGTVTVPALWDKQNGCLVNNESSEIIRFFNSEFQEHAEHVALDLYPEHLRKRIDTLNAWVYRDVNNGVYRSGFARTQAAYDAAVSALFAALDRLEGILAGQRFLLGEVLTEADIRLFTTLFRFDHVYHTHFKCNRRRIVDYPALWAYTRDLYALPGVAGTCHLQHIREHYYRSHESINPRAIVAIGPELDFDAPHDRATRFV